MPKTTRTSISVPFELKARMDASQEEINWSVIACKAFEDRLNNKPDTTINKTKIKIIIEYCD